MVDFNPINSTKLNHSKQTQKTAETSNQKAEKPDIFTMAKKQNMRQAQAVMSADGSRKSIKFVDAGNTNINNLNDSTRIITTEYEDGNRLKYKLNPQTGETEWIENTYKGIKNEE